MLCNLKGEKKLQVDIEIDKLTDGLIDRETGNIVKTNYIAHAEPMKKKEYAKWKFDWSITQKMEIPSMNFLLPTVMWFREELH